jgi:hypothetical protein
LGHDLITHLHRLRCCAVKQGQNISSSVRARAEATAGSNERVNQLFDHVPHLLIAVNPPMRNPREMSSNGLVSLIDVVEGCRDQSRHDRVQRVSSSGLRKRIQKGIKKLTTRTPPIQRSRGHSSLKEARVELAKNRNHRR